MLGICSFFFFFGILFVRLLFDLNFEFNFLFSVTLKRLFFRFYLEPHIYYGTLYVKTGKQKRRCFHSSVVGASNVTLLSR